MKFVKYILLIGLLFLASRIIAQPSAPTNLNAVTMKYEFQGQTKVIVKLDWNKSLDQTGADVPVYNIYRKDGDANSSNEFMMISQVLWHTTYRDDKVVQGNSYTYFVTALKNGESERSNLEEITVSDNPTVGGTAYLSGNVADSVTNNPIEGVYVSAMSLSSLSTEIVQTDSEGNYSFELLPGEYVLYFRAPQNYFPEFYENARHIWEATSFILSDTDNYTGINVIMNPISTGEMFNISGKVTDEDGNALEAVVDAMIIGEGNYPRKHNKILTDSEGNYSLSVLEGAEIVVYAHPKDNAFLGEFYNNSFSLVNAEHLTISENIENIDFILEQRTEGNASITGLVSDSLGNPVQAMVIAYRLGAERFKKDSQFRTFTDDLGNYSFNNLIVGDYIIYVLPEEGYIPTFYSDNSDLEFHWFNATTLSLVANSELVDINFVMMPIPETPENGFSEIAGMVKNQNGEPVANAYVYAYTETGKVKSFTFTNYNGEYSLRNLVPGLYRVECNNYGYESDGSDEVFASTNEEGEANFTLSDQSIVGVETDVILANDFKLHQNYPNPFNPTTKISFSLKENGNVDLNIYNILGSKVKTLISDQLQSGSYEITFDASELPSGIYFYELTSGNFTQTKKMMLLK